MTKRAKISLTVGLICFVAILATVLCITLIPVGNSDRAHIEVVSYASSGTLIIPVKMENGVHSPTRNAFNSDKTLKELCQMYAGYKFNDTPEYHLLDKGALLFSSENNAVQAQLMTRQEGDKYDYVLTSGAVTFKGVEIIVPMYLSNNYSSGRAFEGSLNLIDTVNFDKVIDYYGMFDKTIVCTRVSQNVIAVTGNNFGNKTIKVEYFIDTHTVKYSVS